MRRTITLSLVLAAMTVAGTAVVTAQTADMTDRALWGSVADDPSTGAISLGDYKQHNGKLLLTWRMLPTDTEDTAFDLYRRVGTGSETQVNKTWRGVTPIKNTCYQDAAVNAASALNDVTYRLTYTGQSETLSTFTFKADRLRAREPFFTIPLKSTEDVSGISDIVYQANDCSVGDLDGDGQFEVVVKRLLTVLKGDGSVESDGAGAEASDRRARHCVVWDAYKLDGTHLWRIKSGPNIILGNSSNFAMADLDGDGRCEFVTKTGEGTVFGDGREIGDTDGDGCTDYRDNWVSHYTGPSDKGPGGPEFFSVCDGATGRELARAPFISATDRGNGWKAQSESWGDNYWKRANSLRLGVAQFTGKGMQVFLGRGVYGRTVVEAWQYDRCADGDFEGTLTRLWHFDTSNAGGSDTNKDGKSNAAYAAQGNHAFNVADLDGDGLDEVMYGSCAWDNDGTGLWSSGLGHGDANHVGKFLPGRDGLQVFHCLETGTTQIALHDARDGAVIWKKADKAVNDMGRCMVADVDPASPGCEFWMYGNELFSQDGTELKNADGSRKTESSANAGIWFDGSLSRQLINESTIRSFVNGRTFTMSRYDISFNNGTKSNPGWMGDMLGDWREEVIVPDATKLKDLKVFSTWYPTDHRFPWLMTDHTYYMQCIHQQVGYNQPNNLGYYLGSDLSSDAEAWEAARKVEADRLAAQHRNATAVSGVTLRPATAAADAWYTLDGRRLSTAPAASGIYIHGGRKAVVR